jgi:hypothetical protein
MRFGRSALHLVVLFRFSWLCSCPKLRGEIWTLPDTRQDRTKLPSCSVWASMTGAWIVTFLPVTGNPQYPLASIIIHMATSGANSPISSIHNASSWRVCPSTTM